jgi:hypothetical protein
MKDNICSKDDMLYAWVMAWFAQSPEDKLDTSLVLRGKQGVGKTKVGEVFGSLLGRHHLLVAEPRYVTGRFNAHMAQLLLLHSSAARRVAGAIRLTTPWRARRRRERGGGAGGAAGYRGGSHRFGLDIRS